MCSVHACEMYHVFIVYSTVVIKYWKRRLLVSSSEKRNENNWNPAHLYNVKEDCYGVLDNLQVR